MVFSNKLRKAITIFREVFFVTLGLALYALAWNFFVLPNGIVGGGFGGICAMIYYLYGLSMQACHPAHA